VGANNTLRSYFKTSEHSSFRFFFLFFVRHALDLTQGFYLVPTFHERIIYDEREKYDIKSGNLKNRGI
jgi:hypothetical protein